MAQKSGFFNALQVEGEFDRKYNANDYTDNLAVVISNGVLRSTNNDLHVTGDGMIATVAAGRAWINGHYYLNDSDYAFPAVSAPMGGNRYDRVMLRLDKSLNARSISLVYVEGTVASSPTKPAPVREGDIYDLVLADIYVAANATSISVTDTRGDRTVCGWLYSTAGDNSFFTSLDASFNEWFAGVRDTLSSVTLFKRYEQVKTLESQTSTVIFDIPQYDADTCFLEVFVNGILDTRNTVSGTTITFAGTLVAGTVVTIRCYKSIDGTGIMDVADEITELQNQMAAMIGANKFTYKCTGANDNISLSQIAKAFYDGSYTVGTLSQAAEAFLSAIGGNTYLAALPSEFQATIDVVGVLGASTPYAGTGASDSRYRWFALGTDQQTPKRLVFDFAKCPKVAITCAANTNNIVFYGTDMYLRNLTAEAISNGNGCNITMIVGSNRTNTLFENCRFTIRTTGKAIIAHSGNFTNCDMHVKSAADHAFCIDAKSAGYTRIDGGVFYAYTGTTAKIASVFNVESNETAAAIIANRIHCPVVAQTGYYQNYYARHNAGMTVIYGIITTMNPSGNAQYISVSNKITASKQ